MSLRSRTKNNPQLIMLGSVQDVLRSYAEEHRNKAHRIEKTILGCSDEVECELLRQQKESTTTKAEANEAWVKRIGEVLEGPMDNVLQRTAEFGLIANPNGFSGKSQQAQLGVHFEEVAEMAVTVQSSDPDIQAALEAAWEANEKLGTLLKERSNDPSITVINSLEFIDSVADQLVTATLCAVQFHMDPVGALREVNRSNYSKLTDGVMAIDPTTNKWIKGPDYSPPKLHSYT